MTTEITKIINGFKEFSENPYVDSINFLNEYIEVEPSSEAFFELGKALFFNEEYDKSIEYLEKSDDYRSDAYIGLDYFKKEDFENAISHFKRFLKDNHNETILSYLMISYERVCDWRNAVVCGEELLEIKTNEQSIKVRLVDYHFNLREYQKSIEYMDELNYPKLQYKKGLALFKLKKYEEAIEELKTLNTIESYKLISESYLKLDRPSKAIRYLLKSYEKNPDIEILLEISDISLENQYYQQSLNVLERVLMEDSKNEKALEGMAQSYLSLQKFEIAIEYCEKLLDVNENNIDAYIILSETYYFLHDLEKALEYVERGLDLNPESADLWLQKAWVRYPNDSEDFKRALKKAIRLEPNATNTYITLINEYLWDDDLENAHKYYEKLLFYNPTFTISFDEITKATRILKKRCAK